MSGAAGTPHPVMVVLTGGLVICDVIPVAATVPVFGIVVHAAPAGTLKVIVTVADWLGCSVPTLQDTLFDTAQAVGPSAGVGLVKETAVTVKAAFTVSVNVTSLASATPVLVTDSVYVFPALPTATDAGPVFIGVLSPGTSSQPAFQMTCP